MSIKFPQSSRKIRNMWSVAAPALVTKERPKTISKRIKLARIHLNSENRSLLNRMENLEESQNSMMAKLMDLYKLLKQNSQPETVGSDIQIHSGLGFSSINFREDLIQMLGDPSCKIQNDTPGLPSYLEQDKIFSNSTIDKDATESIKFPEHAFSNMDEMLKNYEESTGLNPKGYLKRVVNIQDRPSNLLGSAMVLVYVLFDPLSSTVTYEALYPPQSDCSSSSFWNSNNFPQFMPCDYIQKHISEDVSTSFHNRNIHSHLLPNIYDTMIINTVYPDIFLSPYEVIITIQTLLQTVFAITRK